MRPTSSWNGWSGVPPEQVNVYTDGALMYQATLGGGIGGYGAMAVGPLGAPLIPAPHDVWVHQGEVGGRRALWGTVEGRHLSSTRCESAGIIGALLHPQPVHIGCDSLNAVKRLQLLVAFQGKTKTPEAFAPDGDLWTVIGSLVRQKGPSNRAHL